MYVLDTNILVAALWSRSGASFQIVQRALDGRIRIAISVALALEYEAVLHRATLREASWASRAQVDTILDAVIASAQLVAPIRTRLRPTLQDPDDDMVLECAVQSGADAIVTMNVRDFAAALSVYRLEVIRPGALLARLKSGETA
jgi:putative PIN family toxin of toxin-antitoxin system|uniref:putative toxin-antitoxin system toxin component, PIN family n=1 Tax=uncultured Sphingomonas sp. TaxID=158754 RepID=UPI0035CAA79E